MWANTWENADFLEIVDAVCRESSIESVGISSSGMDTSRSLTPDLEIATARDFCDRSEASQRSDGAETVVKMHEESAAVLVNGILFAVQASCESMSTKSVSSVQQQSVGGDNGLGVMGIFSADERCLAESVACVCKESVDGDNVALGANGIFSADERCLVESVASVCKESVDGDNVSLGADGIFSADERCLAESVASVCKESVDGDNVSLGANGIFSADERCLAESVASVCKESVDDDNGLGVMGILSADERCLAESIASVCKESVDGDNVALCANGIFSADERSLAESVASAGKESVDGDNVALGANGIFSADEQCLAESVASVRKESVDGDNVALGATGILSADERSLAESVASAGKESVDGDNVALGANGIFSADERCLAESVASVRKESVDGDNTLSSDGRRAAESVTSVCQESVGGDNVGLGVTGTLPSAERCAAEFVTSVYEESVDGDNVGLGVRDTLSCDGRCLAESVTSVRQGSAFGDNVGLGAIDRLSFDGRCSAGSVAIVCKESVATPNAGGATGYISAGAIPCEVDDRIYTPLPSLATQGAAQGADELRTGAFATVGVREATYATPTCLRSPSETSSSYSALISRPASAIEDGCADAMAGDSAAAPQTRGYGRLGSREAEAAVSAGAAATADSNITKSAAAVREQDGGHQLEVDSRASESICAPGDATPHARSTHGREDLGVEASRAPGRFGSDRQPRVSFWPPDVDAAPVGHRSGPIALAGRGGLTKASPAVCEQRPIRLLPRGKAQGPSGAKRPPTSKRETQSKRPFMLHVPMGCRNERVLRYIRAQCEFDTPHAERKSAKEVVARPPTRPELVAAASEMTPDAQPAVADGAVSCLAPPPATGGVATDAAAAPLGVADPIAASVVAAVAGAALCAPYAGNADGRPPIDARQLRSCDAGLDAECGRRMTAPLCGAARPLPGAGDDALSAQARLDVAVTGAKLAPSVLHTGVQLLISKVFGQTAHSRGRPQSAPCARAVAPTAAVGDCRHCGARNLSQGGHFCRQPDATQGGEFRPAVREDASCDAAVSATRPQSAGPICCAAGATSIQRSASGVGRRGDRSPYSAWGPASRTHSTASLLQENGTYRLLLSSSPCRALRRDRPTTTCAGNDTQRNPKRAVRLHCLRRGPAAFRPLVKYFRPYQISVRLSLHSPAPLIVVAKHGDDLLAVQKLNPACLIFEAPWKTTIPWTTCPVICHGCDEIPDDLFCSPKDIRIVGTSFAAGMMKIARDVIARLVLSNLRPRTALTPNRI